MRLNFQLNRPKNTVKYVEKKDYTIVYTIGVFIIIGIIGLISFNIYKNNKCTSIEDKILEYTTEYAEGNNLLKLKEGDYVIVNIDDIYNNGYQTITNGGTCTGTVKFTMAEEKIIKTLDITGCGFCSTNQRYKKTWNKSNTYVNSKLIDVDVKYNYYNAETFYTKWTEWYPSSEIDKAVNVQYGVTLPKNIKKYPAVPETSEVLKYDVEYKTYYSYRDMTWLWYKNDNNDYSNNWYSTKPNGYANKDEKTLKYTDWSNWSLNYPEEESYRSIKSSTGYRWYYLDEDKEKHYWNGGAYAVECPDNNYPSSDDSAKMYSYRDATWRWYNGDERNYYYQYSQTEPRNYPYKDPLMTSYTKWSNWSADLPESKENRSIESDLYYRYRAFYRDVNFLVLNDYLSKEEFQEKIGTTLEEFRHDNTKKISYKYTYLYK